MWAVRIAAVAEHASRATAAVRRAGIWLSARFGSSVWLWLAPAIYAVQLALELGYRAAHILAHPELSDFLPFYAAATLSATNAGDLYSSAAQFQIEHQIAPQLDIVYPFFYAPPVAFALRPLAGLPFLTAQITFMVVSALALLAAGVLLARMLPTALRSYQRALIVVTVVGYAGIENVGLNQWGSLQLLALVLGAGLIRSGRGISGGLILALILVKPNLALLLLPALVVGRHWRAAIGLGGGGVLWLGSSVLLTGVDGFGHFLSALGRDSHEAPQLDGIPSLGSAVLGTSAGMVIAAALGAAILVVLVRQRDRLRDSDVAIAVGITASFVAAPLVHRWDALVAAFPLTLLARHNHAAAILAGLALGVSTLLPRTTGLVMGLALLVAAGRE